ncbi:MAG: hypothetical protein IPP19_11630 [Verrucomicrobia bacterium]|nr:hypothetical protein [Verrucomicrobiota bacterium]
MLLMASLRKFIFSVAVSLPLLASFSPLEAQTLRKLPYVGGAEQVVNEDPGYLYDQYIEWRNHYVVDGYHPMGFLSGKRVMRDASSDYDTVSEGQAYGMLLAVYCDDQETFDQLYRYAMDHFDPEKGLMHWLQNKYGTNISEFGLPIDSQGAAYIYRKVNELKLPITVIPKIIDSSDPLWGIIPEAYRSADGSSAIIPPTYLYNEPDRTASLPSADYIKAAHYNRNYSAAPDADLDIATALCFANRKWGWSNTLNSDYRDLAAQMIKSFMDHETETLSSNAGKSAGHRFQKAGNAWGSNFVWNPSYFMPAWFEVYIKFIQENKSAVQGAFNGQADEYIAMIQDLLKTMTAHMGLIRRKSNDTLYPDWCDTSDPYPLGKVQKVSPSKQGVSDRLYYLDENEDDVIDDRNGDGRITTADAYRMQSFNFYYDAVRVPWRMGMHYAWNGGKYSEYYMAAYNVARFFYPKFYENNIVDGYSMKGGEWNIDDRDGFQVTEEGSCMRKDIIAKGTAKNKNSPTFIAMIGAASLAYGDPSYTQGLYDLLKYQCQSPLIDDKTGKPTNFNYYGNTLRLLSMLYMTGYMADYSVKPANLRVGETCLDSNDWTGNMSMQLQVRNTGKESASLSNITLKYWFSDDRSTTDGAIAEVDYAFISTPSYVRVWANATVSIVDQAGQNRCMTITFPGSTENLPPNGQLELQIRIHKENYMADFYQPNDHSFTPNTQGTWNRNITAYYKWEKVWGYEPGTE